jgi:histidinol-phosphate/aromatic aminotransferase/cobyric acid decarboxylase-like protein
MFKVRSAYDVTAMAALCATRLLRYPQIVGQYVEDVEKGADILENGARRLQIRPIRCPTNFMLLQLPEDTPVGFVIAALRERGVLVKGPFDSPCLRQCVRVTLGPPELMKSFLGTFTEVLEDSRRVVRS